jgi:hypothetical protein
VRPPASPPAAPLTVDARAGTEQWRVPLEAPSPWWALGRDTVLVGTETAFVALDRETGTIRWQASAGEAGGPVGLVDAPDADPVAVVATQAGGLAGLDAITGVTRWSLRLPGARGLLGSTTSRAGRARDCGDDDPGARRLNGCHAGSSGSGRTGTRSSPTWSPGVAEAELAGEARGAHVARRDGGSDAGRVCLACSRHRR